jgi:hypothetical protein
MRGTEYRSWWYYKVEFIVHRIASLEDTTSLQKHAETYWTPYAGEDMIDSHVEDVANRTGWKFYTYEWKIVDERKGIPSTKEHPHMVMEI